MIRPLLHQWLTIYALLQYYHHRHCLLVTSPTGNVFIHHLQGGGEVLQAWGGLTMDGIFWNKFTENKVICFRPRLAPSYQYNGILVHFVSSNISQLRGNPPTVVEEEGKPKVRSDSPELVLSLIVSDWHWKLERPTLEGGHCTQCVVNTPIWT